MSTKEEITISEGNVEHQRWFYSKSFGIAIVDADAAWDIPKPLADEVARAYRAKGWLARVVKTTHGYTTYRSQNKADFYR